ncbi:Uncharacterized protein LHYA1_G001203 [Lachnellula hyalina]|uniref:N-acetyltransferase domain-containing protein n=1 Tax=Lachnellula hyalina TaxID=1316788 RepID=A0A8H8U416_9HELO|nr:Uncharacterized protein LHYA1_G001203 [Lachnellula hyalina]TVY30624.1 Uncharacterized protein LHYA1_G001203 [Lachnellula hyalina]
MAAHEPEGDPVSTIPSITPSIDSPLSTLHGQYITLRPLQLSDAPLLYHSLGGPSNASLWTYLPTDPFLDLESFTAHIEFLCTGTVFIPFVLLSHNPAHIPPALSSAIPSEGVPVGVTALLSIVPAHHTIEIGHVLYSPLLQRSTASTETSFLLMKLCFEELRYERVEWKCNDRNKPSMNAAKRLGFRYEGTFRRHLVVKGRRRDTAWFSVVVEEWGSVKRVLESWLGGGGRGLKM